MHRPALLAHKNVLYLFLLEKLVVNRQHRSAGIAEDVLNALIDHRLDDHLGTRQLQWHAATPNAAPGSLTRYCQGRHPSQARPRGQRLTSINDKSASEKGSISCVDIFLQEIILRRSHVACRFA